MSANGTLRSWLAFLNVRCDHHAEKEVQIIATKIGEILEKEMPGVFATINWRNGMFM
jgi:thymidylate synthase ThyX